MSFVKPRSRSDNATRHLLERVFDSVRSLIAVIDCDFNFVWVNRAYADANGKRPAYFVGKNHFELFPSDENKAVFTRVVETGAPLQIFEKTLVLLKRPCTEVLYWDWSIDPIRERNGATAALALTLVDVTYHRRVRVALRVSEETREEIAGDRERVERARARLTAAIEQAVESVAMTDRNGVVRYVNPSFEQITGYSREEIVGEHLRILDGETQDVTRHRFKWEAMARGEVWHGRVMKKKKSGDLYQVDTTITPISDPEDANHVTSYVVTERDISREVKLEMQLRQAQKMEALGTLAGGIAHDLNNILMPIIMNAEMIEEDVDEESPLHHFAGKVISSAHRGRNLVRRILTFSREKDAEKKRFAIVHPVREALDLVSATLLSTVELVECITEDVGQVEGDPAEIQEVIVNLCSNAAHAVGVEKGVIKVSLENVNMNEPGALAHSDLHIGPYVRLSVSDTGIGMDEQLIERIFDPFFTTKKPSEGTGMGLAMVHGAVRRHHGAMVVSSAPGRGATFEVYLPRVSPTADEAEEARPIPTGKGECLLIVDDDADVAEATQNVLTRLGYRVTAHTSATAALEVFRRDGLSFDLAIVDFALPEMTGLELARQMKAIRPDMRIIMATGFSGAVNRREIEASGLSDLVSKPLSTREVGEVIRRVLERSPIEKKI